MTDAVQYHATLSAPLADDAGRRFTRFVYLKLFGWKLALAWIVNAGACLLGIVFVGWTGPTIGLCVLIAISTIYFGVNFALRPGVISRRLQRAFDQGVTITLRPDGFDLERGPNKVTRPWGRQRAILEYEHYFLLVILPTIGLALPRQGMPAQGEAWVRAAMHGPMTRGPWPGL